MSTRLLSTFVLLILISFVCNNGVESRNLIFEGSGDMCWLGCPKILSPVCGSNGKTYSNECRLIQERECNGFRLKKEHDGPCKRVFPMSISEYNKQELRKSRLCNGNRLTVCSLMGGLCVKTYKGNFVCQLSKVDRSFALNIAI